MYTFFVPAQTPLYNAHVLAYLDHHYPEWNDVPW